MILSDCMALKWLFVFFNLKLVNVLLCILPLCVSLRKISRKYMIMLQAKTEEQKLRIMQIAQKFAEGHVFVRDNHMEFDGSIIEYDGMAEIVDFLRNENEEVEIPTTCSVSANLDGAVYDLRDTPHNEVMKFCKKLAWVKGGSFGDYYEQYVKTGKIRL